MQASKGPQNKGALLLRLPTKRANKVVHVDVVLAVPVVVVVVVVVVAQPTEEKAVCKREGDVRDQEKQQEQDEHRETTKVYANGERERNIWVSLDLREGATKGETSKLQWMRTLTIWRNTFKSKTSFIPIHLNRLFFL